MSITTTTQMTAESPDRTPSPTAYVQDTAPGEATLLWCFTQNQRNEVRLLGTKAMSLITDPSPGTKNQTYVVTRKPMLCSFTQNQRNEVRLLGEKAGAVMANPGMKQQTYVVVLNDQGGAVMSVTENKTNTLRAQDHGHPPLIIIRKEHDEDCNRTVPVQSSSNRTEDHDSLCVTQ